LRPIDQRNNYSYAKANAGGASTVLFALVIWAAIFGAGWLAWSLLDALR
jgi:hypothetical protein